MSKYFGRDVETEKDDSDDYEYDKDGNIVYYALRPNKTQIKKEYAMLFNTAEQMAKLSIAHLESLQLPPKIHEALLQISNMPLNNARKRLLKYIAGQFYKIDYAPYLEQLATMQNKNAHATREHHFVERWRNRLLADNAGLTALIDQYPQADGQQLRQLIRNTHKETAANHAPKSSRLLYQYLKELFSHVPPDSYLLETDNEIDDEDGQEEMDFEMDEADYDDYDEAFDDEDNYPRK